MPHRILLAVLVEVAVDIGAIQLKVVVQEGAQVGAGSVFRVRQNFDPVAGRKNHALFDARKLRQFLAGFRQTAFRNGKALANLDRSRMVIHADELESHDGTNL